MVDIFMQFIFVSLFVLIAGFLSRAALEFHRRKQTIEKFEEEEAEIWLPQCYG